jgi:hypothetical protein
MSISQNFPEEGPTLNLNFAGSRTLDPRITFTRTSSATYMGRDGLVKIAPANSARFDHRYNSTTGEVESLGLLVEESRSNLNTNSENFETYGFAAGSGLSNQGISPDGNNNADLIQAVGGGAFKTISGINTALTHTASVYVKYVSGGQNFSFGFDNIQNTPGLGRVVFGLNTKTILGVGSSVISYSFDDIGNNWFRCSVTAQPTNTSTSIVYYNSTISGSEYLVWGAQLEQGSFPTSYIPTTTSTATRTADNASITGSNFTKWYNQSEGTVFINSYGINPSGTFYSIEQGNQSVSNSILLGATPNNLTFRVRGPSNTTQALFELSNVGTFNIFKKYIGTYKLDSFNAAVNGVLSSDDTSGTPPSPQDNLKIGYNGSPNTNINGHIAQLTYYPNRLINSQLIALTR